MKPLPQERTKYGNKRYCGYASKREANRAYDLSLMEVAGLICNLRYQVKFELVPKQDGERAVNYFADFVYEQDGKQIVEDVKGFRTPDYIIKRKLMLFLKGIKIVEV